MKKRKITISLFVITLLAFISLSSTFAQKNDSRKNFTPVINGGQTSVSLEEQLVRMAYRKMNVLDTVERFVKVKPSTPSSKLELTQNSLRFDLKDFRVGQIQEIQSALYQDLVTPPRGDIIQVTIVNSKHNDGETKVSLDSQWRTGQYSSGVDQQWTVGDILQLEAVRFNDVGRYASYEVTVSLNGKTRTYRALALFHNLYQQAGKLEPEILDSIVGMGGVVTQVLQNTKLPLSMKKSSDQSRTSENAPIKAKDIKTSEIEIPMGNQQNLMAPPDSGPGCLEWYYTPIDPTYTYCMVWDWEGWGGGGGGGGGSSCTPSTSVTNPPQKIDHDDTYHASGNHLATTRFQTVCSLSSDCVQSCNINNDIAAFNENGVTNETLYYHVGGSTVTRRGSTGPKNNDISCETAFGYSFKRCLFSNCGVSVTLGISGHGASASVTVSGGDLWNVGHIEGRTCRNGQ